MLRVSPALLNFRRKRPIGKLGDGLYGPSTVLLREQPRISKQRPAAIQLGSSNSITGKKTMSFVSILKHIGHDIVVAFNFADKAATLAEPFVEIANPAIGSILNTTLMAVSQAEALGEAAAAGKDTSAQKLASVIAAIKPTISSELVSLGVSANDVN